MSGGDESAMNLLQQLSELQSKHGWLSEETLRAFSAETLIPLYEIQAVASFYPHYRLKPPPRAHVAVCRDASCHLAGCDLYTSKIKAGLAGDFDIEVHEVSCLGRCESAPAACVDDVPVLGWTADDVIAGAKGEQALPPDEPTSAPRRWPTDPHETTDDHYAVLRKWMADRDAARAEIPALLEAAGLKGMGGAGFPPGLKGRLVRDSGESGINKYAVVNADESEPGTFKDRVILEEQPHLVLEGLLLGCLVSGADEGIIYIRHEYGREKTAMEREIERARQMGLLDDLGVNIWIFVSPGGYILGEETALIEALEGKRGEPRNKPPYPTDHGIHGQPTLMNNVETYSFVPAILSEGADSWKAHGINGGTGWKFLSVSGDVEKPGVYCVPMGITLRDLVEQECGGMKNGVAMKAFCPGGASAPFLPASLADTPLEWGAVQEAGSMLGSGAVMIVAEGHDMLELAANVVRFFRNESCGKCVPCRVGSEKAVDILDRVLAGEGDGTDFDVFPALDEALRLTSICGLGQVVLNPATSVLKHFPDDVARHLGTA